MSSSSVLGRLKLLLGALACAALVVAGLAYPASAQTGAQPAAKKCASPSKQGDAARTIASMRRTGASLASVDKALAANFCLVDIGKAPAVRPYAANQSGVNLDSPTIYYDTQARTYDVYAYWQWNSAGYADLHSQWSNDWGCWSVKCSLGGPDSVGLAFSGPVKINSGGLYWAGKGYYFSTSYNSTHTLAMNNFAGGTYNAQDVFASVLTSSGHYDEYSMDNGVISMQISSGSGSCESVYGVTGYNHNWNANSITGAQIWEAGISWSNSNSSAWNYDTYGGGWATIC